jgi:succinate-semialdehyde dehydrogenase/glutarate-semialdehyde dehydrogenase
MSLTSINPATGEAIQTYPEHTQDECNQILDNAVTAFGKWRALSFAERGDCFRRLAALLRENAENLAQTSTAEMGKPIRDARGEVEKCAWVCEYYADVSEAALQDKRIETDASKSYVTYEPLGVILGIMPWNFPIWQVLRYSAPTMMAGNTTVLSHANNVTGVALAIEKLFGEAAFPQDAFRALIIDVPQIEGIIQDDRIAGVTLTGSPHAGRAVAGAAASVLKKCVLELGGSDPFVILEDADLDAAIEMGVTSRLMVSGQVCIAAKRFIVPESIRSDVEERLVARMKKARMGDPTEEETTFGPLARTDLRDTVASQVEASIKSGARLLEGGVIPEGPGSYYPATVLTDVRPGMPAYDEEVFGPVAAVIGVADEAEAIRVANDTPYGLGAVVFSADTERAEGIARNSIRAGCCFVNSFVKSDPRLPFGGIKQSGYGRELGTSGLKEFVNVKTIYIA